MTKLASPAQVASTNLGLLFHFVFMRFSYFSAKVKLVLPAHLSTHSWLGVSEVSESVWCGQ